MNKTTTSRGGRRPGAGRKPSPDGRTERLSVRLTPRLADRLRESGRAGELIEAAFDFGDENQNGLTLSWLAEFARIGSLYWEIGGNGMRVDEIPLGMSDAELRESWTSWLVDGTPDIEAA